MKIPGRFKSSFLFPSILFLAAVLYCAILFTSQSRVDGDEGVVGIMARHIITRGSRPIFFYGQQYGGGGALEAYLAVAPFLIFGQNAVSLKLIGLTAALLTLTATYCFCRRYINSTAALISSALLATATPLIEWHFKIRGGYILLPLFIIGILLLYCRIAYRDHPKKIHYFLLGLISGLAYYNKESILALLLTLFLTSFCWKKKFWRFKSLSLITLGLLLGLSPIIYYNITHNYANLYYLLYIGTGGENPWLAKASGLFGKCLPGFFVGRNVDRFIPRIPVRAWIEYLIYGVLFLFILFRRRAAFPAVFRGWLPKKLFTRIPNSPPPESLLIIYILVFLGIHTLSRAIFFSPRYLLPLFPALTIVAGSSLDELWHSRYRSVKAIAVFLFLVLLSLGLINHLGYIRPPTITEDVDIAERKIENLQTSGRTVRAIIEYLKSREAYHVHCSYFLQWRIIFESRESIIASSRQFSVTPSRFPEYDRRVAEADRVAIIFHRDSFQHGKFRRSVYGRGREGEEINEYIVYILNRPGGGQSGP